MSAELLFLLFSILLIAMIIRGYYYYAGRVKKISRMLHSGADNQHDRSSSSLSQLEDDLQIWMRNRNEEYETLQKLESYRKDYLGNVSHELKTPIFNIQGYLSTILDEKEPDIKLHRSFLEKSMRNVDRMIAIVDDLQTITQLEKGELELEEENFDLLQLIRDVIEAQDLKAKEKNISIELINKTNAERCMVFADRFRIRQVLVNLIVNSLRYGKNNGNTSIKVSTTDQKSIIEVADTGIGMKSEYLKRIFERFYRVDKSRSREQGGTGLGLAIVKHLLEAHGQSIQVMSTEGVGSVFTFTLKKSQPA